MKINISIALANILALSALNGTVSANEKPPFTDYCQRLEQDVDSNC
jgi:hypothetical protein